jgi:Resolvase, N terminal domain
MSAVRTVVCYMRTANPPTIGQRLLARQRARLQAARHACGWTVIAWIEDLHQSGTTLDRPGLRDALALLAGHQADALLASDHSRLAISPVVAGALAALAATQGWQFLTLTSSNPAPGGPRDRHLAGLSACRGGPR